MVKQKDTPKFGRYEAQQELAQGGMGSVYIGKDPVLMRPIAIKVLHSKFHQKAAFVQRFFQEAKTVANLRSPHIVEVYDFGREQGMPYLVMEYVDGLSLHGVLDALYPEGIDPVVAAALMCQAAEGLAAASQRGVVHRDIKPENLLISPAGYLKIADFGISHVKDNTITRTGAVVGTVQYMSPEQASGDKGISVQSDMFSLGTVFYICLSGIQPFKSESLPGTIKKIIAEPHPPLEVVCPWVDKELIDLVNILLQKDPKHRGGGPNWLKAKLREYLYKKRVADPVERIRLYLTELSGKGIQTTGFINPLHIASAIGSLSLPRAPESPSRMGLKVWGGLGILLVLAGLGGGFAWKMLERPAAPSMKAEEDESPLPFELNPVELRRDTSPPPPLLASNPRSVAAPPEKAGVPLSRPPYKREGPEPKPPPPPAGQGVKEKGRVFISTSPPFADIFVDGHQAGTTPMENVMLLVGRHRILMEATQVNATLDTVIEIRPGENRFKFKLYEANGQKAP